MLLPHIKAVDWVMLATRYPDAAAGDRGEYEAETAVCTVAGAEVVGQFMRDILFGKGE